MTYTIPIDGSETNQELQTLAYGMQQNMAAGNQVSAYNINTSDSAMSNLNTLMNFVGQSNSQITNTGTPASPSANFNDVHSSTTNSTGAVGQSASFGTISTKALNWGLIGFGVLLIFSTIVYTQRNEIVNVAVNAAKAAAA